MGHTPTLVALVAFLSLFSVPLTAATLSRPAGLEPDIEFWRRSFTEVTSEQALIHDNRRLDIVYETVDVPAGTRRSQQRRISEQARKKYRRILSTLADGKRSGLTSEEARVLALWPNVVTNDELRAAARRVRFQQGLADRFYDGLIRSGRWQAYIRQRLRREGVPENLAALPHVESSFNPEARSHVGAAGLWQFTRSTGRRFMQIDHVVDERRDPYSSSDAAARLLSYNYSILKSWPLAITAYNHGVAGMRRAVKTVGTDDIETVVRNYNGRAFGFASRNFYVAFLAAEEAERNAAQYFGPLQKAAPRRELVVVLPEYIPAATLEEAFGVTRQTLRSYNPALMPTIWNGTKRVPRGFKLRLPEEAAELPPNQILAAIPDDRRFADQTPDLYHKVERGDSLSVIAARYRTSVSELVALNSLRSRHRIRAGQVLRLPYTGPIAAEPIPDGANTYLVRRGDTVGSIARRAGISEGELLAFNSIANRHRIYPGQKLRLRGDLTVLAEAVTEPAVIEPAVTEVDTPAATASISMSVTTAQAAAVPVLVAHTPAPLEPLPSDMLAVDSPMLDGLVVNDDTDAGTELVLLADPSDYLVAADGSIEVQAAETLGHYADWLNIRTQRLRDINGYSFRRPVLIGRRLTLDFSAADPASFLSRRMAYHRELQEAFFTRYRIASTEVHRMRRGESVWLLSQRRYKVPVWLLRQYNPELDLDRVKPGMEIVFPRISRVTDGGDKPSALADAS